jgi:flavin-binding protein dodecin
MVLRRPERYPHREERPMPDKTYKMVELVGVSEESIQQAVRNAVERASKSLKGLDWFEMTEVRGLVKAGKVSEFQVKVKVGFRILSDKEMRGA